MKDYVLKISIPFQSTDDPAARERAVQVFVGPILAVLPETPRPDIKFVEVYPNKPPRSVKLAKEPSSE